MGRQQVVSVVVLSVVAAMLGGWTWGVAAQLAGSTPVASPSPCPVTEPNGAQPPPDVEVAGRGPGGHGNGALWTTLWMWGEGEVRVPPMHVRPDGSLGPLKWSWYRAVPGPLTVEGHRLDAPAPPLRAYGPGDVRLDQPPATPAGFEVRYPERAFLPIALVFPTEGCWEITGRVGEASLTFVTRVVKVADQPTPGPEATPVPGQ